MNRYDLFNKVYSGFPFWNLLFKDPDDELHQKWAEMPINQREKLIGTIGAHLQSEDIIDFGGFKVPANDRLANAQEVAEYYQYRLASGDLQQLPRLFRRVLITAEDDGVLDVLFLGTLGAMSICLPGVHGSLFNEDILPNLYIFIVGAAASGKGRVGLCRRLLDPINDSMQNSKLIIPANTSDTAFYEELNRNGGIGMMFGSEADTLTQAFSKSSGKFSDGLRCAFHNEAITYLRRTNNERVYIKHPILSMLLTGLLIRCHYCCNLLRMVCSVAFCSINCLARKRVLLLTIVQILKLMELRLMIIFCRWERKSNAFVNACCKKGISTSVYPLINMNPL